MKSLRIYLFAAFTLGLLQPAFSQNSTDTSMIVNGVCGMCQHTIETAALQLEGVKTASWNKNTKVLLLSYQADQQSLATISEAINEAGYDTEYNTASDEAYYSLHKCCYYRDPKVVEDHKEQ